MIVDKDLSKLKATRFTLTTIDRAEVALYPDDINTAFNTDFSFGGYFETRGFYQRGQKVIHTGLDIFEPAGQPIIMPFDGYVAELVVINPSRYEVGRGTGGQLICWHTLDQVARVVSKERAARIFKKAKYLKIIYGHIKFSSKNRVSKKVSFKENSTIISHRKVGQNRLKGQVIATVAPRYENGGWPPHVHVEASLHNKISIINPESPKAIISGSLVGLRVAGQPPARAGLNLIDPEILFGFNNLDFKTRAMELNQIRPPKIIEITNLSYSYEKQKRVLKNLNLTIEEGDLVSILGPSGSGKTTLLNAIAGFLDYEGTIKISNYYNTNDIGYVFQNNLVYDSLSVYKNIFISAANSRRFKYYTYLQIWKQNVKRAKEKDEVNNIYSMLGLHFTRAISNTVFKRRFNAFKKYYNHNYSKIHLAATIRDQVIRLMQKLKIVELANQKAAKLSGGQRQRLAIAKAIIKQPRILIMDEPLNSLDENTKDVARDLIWRLQKELKITLLFVTHNQKEAMLMADKIIVLKNGELMQYGTPETIYDHPNIEFVAKFIGWPAINLVTSDGASKTFVRPRDIIINPSKSSNLVIATKRFVNQNKIYSLDYNGREIRVVSDLDFRIGAKVAIRWGKTHEKIFKKNG